MASYCKVIIVGNLTRDVELRYTPKGSAVAEVGIAVNRKWKTESGDQMEEVSFFNVVCWGKQAEILAQYTRKGAPLLIDGRLKQEIWEDKQTREKKSAVKIIAESFTFLGSNDRGEAGEERTRQQQEPRGRQPIGKSSQPPPQEDQPPDDDVPF